jgi:hypothetical protein
MDHTQMTAPETDDAGQPGIAGGPPPRAIAGQRWDYGFEVEGADEADPAVTLLLGVLGWPSLTMTFSVAQFASFKEGLGKHGIELAGVTRRRHPERTP